MARTKTENEFYTPSEITTILNNAFVAVKRPRSRTLGNVGSEIPDSRLAKLHEMAVATIEPFVELVNEGALRPEEVVAVLQGCALFAQVAMVQKRGIQGDLVTFQGKKIKLGDVWLGEKDNDN